MTTASPITSKEEIMCHASGNVYFKASEEMFTRLVDYMFSHVSSFARYMPSHEPELVKWINEMTPKLSDKRYALSTKIHWILRGLTDFPKCANPECCNKVGTAYNVVWKKGYVKYCSLRCGIRCSRYKSCETMHKHASEDPEFFYNIEQKRKKTKL